VDVLFMASVFHELENRTSILQEVISFCKDEDFKISEKKEAGPHNYLLIFRKSKRYE
jgi:hypothetical protein